MTIEDAIRICEQLVEDARKFTPVEVRDEIIAEYQQLADWLKELLALRQFCENMGRILAKYLNKEQLKELFEGDEND